MEYILEEEEKDNKEGNENTYANASGISLAVSPWSRKYSLILPILIFRSSKRVSRYLFVVSVCLFFPTDSSFFTSAETFRVFNPTAFQFPKVSTTTHSRAQSALYFLRAREHKSLSDGERRGQTDRQRERKVIFLFRRKVLKVAGFVRLSSLELFHLCIRETSRKPRRREVRGWRITNPRRFRFRRRTTTNASHCFSKAAVKE